MGLSLLYGMDMIKITPTVVREGGRGSASVEEEFSSYISTLSSGDADLLAFWKVKDFNQFIEWTADKVPPS